MRHVINIEGRLVGVITAVFVAMVIVGCYASPLEEARTQVTKGTLRDDAIRILSETAWYHQECPNFVGTDLHTITDLFFFGNREYDKADIVIVKSKLVEGVFVVHEDLGSFEPYLWHAVYGDCIQREQFEK